MIASVGCSNSRHKNFKVAGCQNWYTCLGKPYQQKRVSWHTWTRYLPHSHHIWTTHGPHIQFIWTTYVLDVMPRCDPNVVAVKVHMHNRLRGANALVTFHSMEHAPTIGNSCQDMCSHDLVRLMMLSCLAKLSCQSPLWCWLPWTVQQYRKIYSNIVTIQ